MNGSIKKQRDQWLWLIVFSSISEAVSSCSIPVWVHVGTGINISATGMNIVGGGLEGLASALQDYTDDDGIRQLCILFRISFLGVFTSYTYMIQHASTLQKTHLLLPFIYILVTLSSSCLVCTAVRNSFQYYFTVLKRSRSGRNLLLSDTSAFPTVLYLLCGSILLFLLRATWGEAGFVRDASLQVVIGEYNISDGMELFIGMVLSSAAILCSRFLGQGVYVERPHWGTWRCNIAACSLAAIFSRILQWRPDNFLIAKFIMSFCGSLSCFSAIMGHTMVRLH